MPACIMFFFALGNAQSAEESEKLYSQLELPPPELPQPQFFCGYCHVLTYPGIVKKGYELWKKGKHNKYGCVECHYPPENDGQKLRPKGPSSELQPAHIPKEPPQRFSYLPLGGSTVMTRPRVVDASCMTARCHGRPEDDFQTKKIQFTDKVPFIHEPHLKKANQIKGQALNCTSCHQHETSEKKFEVSKASCHLCHFKNTKFNQERSRCELCHQLPEKPIQTSGQEPITHIMLKKAEVSCGSCHYDVIQAAGATRYEAFFEKGSLKTALVLDSGRIKEENCQACHDQAADLKQALNKELMHQKHVTTKNARCFDCHRSIIHSAQFKPAASEDRQDKAALQSASGQEPDARRDFVRNSCTLCHPQPHRLQRDLAAGSKRKDVFKSPSPHLNASANCMACHVQKELTTKGQEVVRATDKACVACHKGRPSLLKDWKAELEREIKFAADIEKEALNFLEQGKPGLSAEQLQEAKGLLTEGQRNLNIVRFGNGVHNKKYSMLLIDAAIQRFDDVIYYIEEKGRNNNS